ELHRSAGYHPARHAGHAGAARRHHRERLIDRGPHGRPLRLALLRGQVRAGGVFLDNYMEWVRKEDLDAAEPSPVAEAILRAAPDRSQRLRYRVKGGVILALVSLLPDAVFRSLIAQGMTRRPKANRP